MKPERFKDSDAAFNLGGAVAAAGVLPPGEACTRMLNDYIYKCDLSLM